MRLRRSPQTGRVLGNFLNAPLEWKYGYDISRNTGLKSGTMYPILMRLAENKLLETRWEVAETGRPPRHMYKLTPNGSRYAREEASTVLEHQIGQPAFGGVQGS